MRAALTFFAVLAETVVLTTIADGTLHTGLLAGALVAAPVLWIILSGVIDAQRQRHFAAGVQAGLQHANAQLEHAVAAAQAEQRDATITDLGAHARDRTIRDS